MTDFRLQLEELIATSEEEISFEDALEEFAVNWVLDINMCDDVENRIMCFRNKEDLHAAIVCMKHGVFDYPSDDKIETFVKNSYRIIAGENNVNAIKNGPVQVFLKLSKNSDDFKTLYKL